MKRKAHDEAESERGSEEPSPYVGAAQVGTASSYGVVPSGTSSGTFLSYDFQNCINITNIKVVK